MKRIAINCLLILSLCGLSLYAHADDIAVIAHPQATFNTVTMAETRQLFMGKSKTLPNAQTALPLMHPEDSLMRTRFDRVVLERDSKQMRAYWAQMIFTGRGKPPRQLADDESMKKEVSANVNAIGYVDGKSVDASVKVVLLIAD